MDHRKSLVKDNIVFHLFLLFRKSVDCACSRAHLVGSVTGFGEFACCGIITLNLAVGTQVSSVYM